MSYGDDIYLQKPDNIKITIGYRLIPTLKINLTKTQKFLLFFFAVSFFRQI